MRRHRHAFDDSVNESVLKHFLGIQPQVTLTVGGDLLQIGPNGGERLCTTPEPLVVKD